MEPSKELVLLPDSVRDLPLPAEFAKLLRAALESEIQRVRTARGEVVAPEDIHGLVRPLQRYVELAGEYMRAFQSTIKLAKLELEEELKDAVGEQDGIPLASYTVPDLDGTDIVLSRDTVNEHDIDTEPLQSAIAFAVLGMNDSVLGVQNLAIKAALVDDAEKPDAEADLENFLAELLIQAQRRLATTGKFEAQISKVKAFAKELAGMGQDKVAATVTGAIRTTKGFRGVSVTRKERK